MRLASVSFTARGSRLNASLNQALTLQGYVVESWAMEKYAGETGLLPLKEPLREWTGRMFEKMDGLLFIGATGIAVRSIAPYVQRKDQDPAVVVMDEKGVFAISLMSGHLGGANELAGVLANLTGAIPVITTATDVNGRFAVDVFAKKQNLAIDSLKAAKAVSADILDEKPVGLLSEFPVEGPVPEELTVLKDGEPFDGKTGMVLSLNEEKYPFINTLHLIPRIVTLGIGCKKGKTMEEIESAVLEALRRNHLSVLCVRQAASVDLKKEEPGILDFCEKYKLPFRTFSAQELLRVEGDFSASDFVTSVTGVNNVCERSAVLASGNGKLIQKKMAGNGVTVALALEKWSVDFE
ncbi:MAG: cobalt-precorrin 5A hydrolase [Candidatus Limivivens sp.]|nr:cobalt-precorrin 5A hydrolase [Candidatus Limivivens sp.]